MLFCIIEKITKICISFRVGRKNVILGTILYSICNALWLVRTYGPRLKINYIFNRDVVAKAW